MDCSSAGRFNRNVIFLLAFKMAKRLEIKIKEKQGYKRKKEIQKHFLFLCFSSILQARLIISTFLLQ